MLLLLLLLLLLLFSHELVATMQSVVTGQGPITLERKITSGGKCVSLACYLVHGMYYSLLVYYYYDLSIRPFVA